MYFPVSDHSFSEYFSNVYSVKELTRDQPLSCLFCRARILRDGKFIWYGWKFISKVEEKGLVKNYAKWKFAPKIQNLVQIPVGHFWLPPPEAFNFCFLMLIRAIVLFSPLGVSIGVAKLEFERKAKCSQMTPPWKYPIIHENILLSYESEGKTHSVWLSYKACINVLSFHVSKFAGTVT